MTNKFIDDLCAINDGRDFSNSFVDIFPPEIDPKLEHYAARTTFLDLDITIKDDILYINYSTKEVTLLFSLSECPIYLATSHLPLSSVSSEFPRTARCSLHFEEFDPIAFESI